MNFRYDLICLSALMLSFFGGAAQASDTTLMRQRMQLEALSHRMITDASLYSVHSGDSTISERMSMLLTEGDGYALQVQSRWPHLVVSWVEIRQFTERNIALNLYAESAYSAWLEGLVGNIVVAYDNAPIEDNILPDQLFLELKMLVGLERLLSSYLRFSNHLFGGHGGVGLGIEEQVKQFEEHLNQLRNQGVKKELERHWFFVKTTLLAYNERSAVYIVERSGAMMRNALLRGLQ